MLKFTSVVSLEMSFEFFHERLPWQPKLPCNSYKNFIYVISTLSSIILSKINDLAQRAHVSKILRHFPNLSHPLKVQPERFSYVI